VKKLETKYLQLPDIRVAYCEHGTGPNLILLHGNSGSKSDFQHYQTGIFRDFHTYAIDSRGHGQSVSEDEKYSIEQFSKDIMQFCSTLGIKKTYVIGYSDGGNISLFLALHAPTIFEKIIAISPNYLVSGATENAVKQVRRIYNALVFLGRLGIRTKKTVMRLELVLNDIGLSREDLTMIQTYIRLLYAENDVIREDHIMEMSRSIPNSTVIKINKSTHSTILQKEETFKQIRRYFGE
jgi:non-heme chloroperoxidase